MGCCAMSPDANINNAVALELLQDKQKEEAVNKILFLGSGGSGKSTFFKQMAIIHGQGFTDDDRAGYHIDICSQILEQTAHMVECIPVINEYLPPNCEPLQLSNAALNSVAFLENLSLREIIDAEIAFHIELLWAEEAIKTVFENRSTLQVDDTISYFLDDIQRIGDKEAYIPTDTDIINVRHRTTGVTSKKFIIENSAFHMFDVGGQKSERKKWIHCFESVTAVIFVSSLSCYDELVFEDTDLNAMHDSLKLFAEICNNQWFISTSIILFLNKNDLFVEKIKSVPLNVCFDDFKQNENMAEYATKTGYYQCLNCIKDKYSAKNLSSAEERTIHIHVTTATDTKNVMHVFNDVRKNILKETMARLRNGGMAL